MSLGVDSYRSAKGLNPPIGPHGAQACGQAPAARGPREPSASPTMVHPHNWALSSPLQMPLPPNVHPADEAPQAQNAQKPGQLNELKLALPSNASGAAAYLTQARGRPIVLVSSDRSRMTFGIPARTQLFHSLLGMVRPSKRNFLPRYAVAGGKNVPPRACASINGWGQRQIKPQRNH